MSAAMTGSRTALPPSTARALSAGSWASGQRASRLMLLTDFSSRVPVIIQPGARRAVLSGDGTAAPKLEFLDGTDRIQPGDLIETSGDGGVFPPDLPIGRVVATQGGTWRAALLADYSRLEFVRLLRYDPDTVIDTPGDLVRPDGIPTPRGRTGCHAGRTRGARGSRPDGELTWSWRNTSRLRAWPGSRS